MAEQVIAYRDTLGRLHASPAEAEAVDAAVRAEGAFKDLMDTSKSRHCSEMSYPYLVYTKAQELLADKENILAVFKAAAGG